MKCGVRGCNENGTRRLSSGVRVCVGHGFIWDVMNGATLKQARRRFWQAVGKKRIVIHVPEHGHDKEGRQGK